MKMEDLTRAIGWYIADAEYREDADGQIVILTGLMVNDEGELVPLV